MRLQSWGSVFFLSTDIRKEHLDNTFNHLLLEIVNKYFKTSKISRKVVNQYMHKGDSLKKDYDELKPASILL